MDLDWHNMTSKFQSVNDLKMKLIDSFPEYIGPSPNFQVGYLEGHGSQKRWIVRMDDLRALYNTFEEGDTMKLWCDGKEKEEGQGCKRKNDDKLEESKSKKERNDEIEADIRTQLEEKHSTDYTAPQYSLWAKLINPKSKTTYIGFSLPTIVLILSIMLYI